MNSDAYIAGLTAPNDFMTFPQMDVPVYKPGTYGRWILEWSKLPPRLRGYFRGLHVPLRDASPTLIRDGRVWMSASPMELESQAPHVEAAVGDVVILGLGLGVLAYNLMQKPEVTSVTAIEKDAELIEHFPEFSMNARWPNLSKLHIIHADALTWKGRAETVLADIWSGVGDELIEEHSQIFSNNIVYARYMAWGSELAYVSWLMAQKILVKLGESDAVAREWAKTCGNHYIPEGWARRAIRAAFNCCLDSQQRRLYAKAKENKVAKATAVTD